MSDSSRSQSSGRKADPTDGLPANIDAERFVLGSIQLDSVGHLPSIRDRLLPEHFCLEKHKLIYRRILELAETDPRIDRTILANELEKRKELKSVGGLTYLEGLDEGLPHLPHIDRYVEIILDKAVRRKVIYATDVLSRRAYLETEDCDKLIASGAELFAGLRNTAGRGGDAEFIENLPPVWRYEVSLTWTWEGIIPAGSVTLLTGEAGGGKSTVALKLAAQVAAGHAFLGRAVSRQAVLYVDGENPLFVVKDRLMRLGIAEHPNLKIWGTWNEPAAEGPGSAKILRFAEKYQPLIVFDSKKAFDGGDEQDATETRRHMNLYRRLSIVGASVVLLHNSGKSDGSRDYRGSSDIKAAVDSAFLLERTDGLDCGAPLGSLRLKPFKSRVMAGEPIRFQYSEVEGFTATDAPPRSPMEKLEDLIRANPLCTQRRLIELARNVGISKNSIGGLLLEGHQKGKFTFQPGKNGAQRWQLSEPDLI